MAGEDLAALGIKIDASESDAAAKSLDNLVAAGGRAEAQLKKDTVSASEFAAALKAAGGDLKKVNIELDGTAATAKLTATSLAGIGPVLFNVATATGTLNAALGITDTNIKSASASAAVFGNSLAGLSALDAATVKVKGLSAEMLALKAAQDGANFNATVSSLAGIGTQFKSARDSAAVFVEAQKLATLQAEEAGLVFYNQTNALLGVGVAYKSARDSAAVFTAALIEQEAAAATGVATFATLAQGINASVGITDEAFKSASASAAVFEQSLQGVAALAASTAEAVATEAEVIVAANESIGASLGALATAATRSAAIQIEAAEATAAAEVASAETQIAAHGAVKGSSIKVRETLVLMREASRGDFTRMAGSATILIQAFGLLNAVFIPLIVTIGTFVSVFALATNQINKGINGTGDLTRGLGLSAEQLARVKDRYVTLGDTIKATFQVIGERLAGFGLLDIIQKVWNGIASFIEGTMIVIVGSVLGGVRLIEEAWKAMPVALGGLGTTAGIDFAKAFQSGLDDTKKAIENFESDVAKKARENALERILKQAGKAPRDGTLNAALRDITKLEDETRAQNALNEAVNHSVIDIQAATDAQQLYRQTASRVAAIEEDAKLSVEQKAMLIGHLTEAQRDYNKSLIEWESIQATAAQTDQLQYLQKETSLIEGNTREREVALASLKAQQEAVARGFDTEQAAKYEDLAIKIANAQVDLKGKTDAYNSSLSLQSELMDELAQHAQEMSSNLADAFGSIGHAVDRLTVTFTEHAAAQAKVAEESVRLAKLRAAGTPDIAKEIVLRQKQTDVDTEYYADVLGAAKNFFSEGSAGYKLLQAAETAYRVFQLVSSFQAIATKEAETAAVIAANTAQTASAATTAVANAAADVPFPFNLGAIATIVAVLAGFGILVGGSGGGGATVPPPDIAKDRQAAQGAGSVLGDSAAKSESIANSLDQLSKNTNRDLEYSNQMVISLRAIQNGIGSLTALLARQLKVGGLFDTASLGLGTSSSSNNPFGSIPVLGLLTGSIFGSSSSSTTLLDQGIKIGATTVGNAISGQIAANAYQTTETTKKSSALFGLISSSSTSQNTKSTALSSQFTDTISDIVSGLRSTVLDAAKKLGLEGAEGVIDSFSLNIGSISFKDMTGEEIQDTLNQVFSALGDQIAEAAVPVITSLQKVGEGSLETLARLAKEYEVVNDAAKTVGFTFSKVGVDSLAARDRLVELSGGLDEFASQASFFVDNFLTSAQALVPIQKAVTDEMKRLGVGAVATKEQFVQLVQGIDTSTAAGASLYAALQAVAPAFAKVADAAQELADKRLNMEIKLLQLQGDTYAATALERQKEMDALDDSLKPLQALINAAEDLSDVLSPIIKQMGDFSNSLSAFLKTLLVGPLANNNISRQYAVAKSIFNTTAQAAANGDPVAIGQLQQASSDFLTASKTASANSFQYAQDLAAVRNAVVTAQKEAQKQLDTATAQLNAMHNVNASVLSVKDAVDNYAKAQLAYNAYQLAHPANDNSAEVAQQIADAIANTNNPANDNQDAYNSVVSQLDSLATAALNLLHGAGVFAEWNTRTNAATGELGSFSVGSNLYNDSSLSGVLAQFQNMQQQYISLFQTAQDLFGQIPSHAAGLSYVPRDGYLAKLHKGERVMTANENQSGGEHVAEIKAMRAELRASNNEVKRNTQLTNDLLRRFSGDGDSLRIKVVG